MEYARLVVRELNTRKQISSSVVLPITFAYMERIKLMASPAQKILDNFSEVVVEPCNKDQFNAENFMLYMKMSNGEIDSDTFQSSVKW